MELGKQPYCDCSVEPTSRQVEKITTTNSIQALFDTSIGFDENQTGLENIKNGLELRLYNSPDKIENAIREVVDFVELGKFLNQPIKNYSKGMRARLSFAVATSIEPKLVLIDEVLGAGDAYFNAKASARMKELLSGDLTLILVSHSTRQVLSFCDRVIWLENGKIEKDGPALTVIKAYEEFIENLKVAKLQHEKTVKSIQNVNDRVSSIFSQKQIQQLMKPENSPLKKQNKSSSPKKFYLISKLKAAYRDGKLVLKS